MNETPPPFPRGKPTEKWSSRQLVRYIEAHEGETRGESEGRARAREEALLKELVAARGEAQGGVAGQRVAGRPALAQYRRETWARFALAVERLPSVRATEGMAGVRLAVASELLPDLYMLGLTPARGPVEATQRDEIRRVLDSPAFVAVLARDDPWADHLRVLFLSETARRYFRPSVWAVYEHGSDELKADRWGTVVK